MPRLDRTFKALAEGDPDSLIRLVCDIPWDQPLEIQHVDREMIIPSRPVDHAYLMGESSSHAIHLEAFAYADHEAADQQIWHANLIACKLRKPVRSFMVLLSPRYPGNLLDPPAVIDLGDIRVSLQYRRVRMWEKDPAWVLAVDRPYLLPWVGAMNSGAAEIQEAARRIRMLEDRELSRRFLSELAILMGIRYTREQIEELTGEIGMWLTEEIVRASLPVQDYAAKARREGQVEQARESIRRVLRARFPKARPLPELDRIADITRLNTLLEVACSAKSAADFRRLLANGSNGHCPGFSCRPMPQRYPLAPCR